jgi:hypothetical protein
MNMSLDLVTFPCLCLHKSTMFAVRSPDALTRTTAAALRGGLFDNLKIVDSTGAEHVVRSAQKLHGVGPFWGYNLFLNQRVRVALDVVPTAKTYTVDEVRKLVMGDFEKWRGWSSRADFEELESSVSRASSSAEILRLVTSAAQDGAI